MTEAKPYILKWFNDYVNDPSKTSQALQLALLNRKDVEVLQVLIHTHSLAVLEFRWRLHRIQQLPDTDERKAKALDVMLGEGRDKLAEESIEESRDIIWLAACLLWRIAKIPGRPDLAMFSNEATDPVEILIQDKEDPKVKTILKREQEEMEAMKERVELLSYRAQDAQYHESLRATEHAKSASSHSANSTLMEQ